MYSQKAVATMTSTPGPTLSHVSSMVRCTVCESPEHQTKKTQSAEEARHILLTSSAKEEGTERPKCRPGQPRHANCKPKTPTKTVSMTSFLQKLRGNEWSGNKFRTFWALYAAGGVHPMESQSVGQHASAPLCAMHCSTGDCSEPIQII